MSVWSELTLGEQAYYMSFHALTVNNVRETPHNNSIISPGLYFVPQSYYNVVRETGDALVRTTHRLFTEGQLASIALWLDENPNIRDEYTNP